MKDAGHYETELVIKKAEADVKRIYQQTAQEVQKKLDDYWRRYRVKDEAKRRAMELGEITKKEYADWRTGQIMMGKRWEEMRNSIAEDLHNANKVARSVVNGYKSDVYALNHNYATFQMERGSKINTSYTLYDRHTVERMIKDQPKVLPDPGANMRRRIAEGRDVAWQQGQIQSVVTQSILQGESIPQMSRRIAHTMGENNRQATTRYARTAMTGAQNAGRVDAYSRAEDMGIEMEQEWVATLDDRTRSAHVILDGQSVPVGEPFIVNGQRIRYPGDPDAPGELIWNCRCTLVPKIKGVDQSNAPRDNRLGSMTYEEWKEMHGG